jgi:hypothetical protein
VMTLGGRRRARSASYLLTEGQPGSYPTDMLATEPESVAGTLEAGTRTDQRAMAAQPAINPRRRARYAWP